MTLNENTESTQFDINAYKGEAKTAARKNIVTILDLFFYVIDNLDENNNKLNKGIGMNIKIILMLMQNICI